MVGGLLYLVQCRVSPQRSTERMRPPSWIKGSLLLRERVGLWEESRIEEGREGRRGKMKGQGRV